MGTRAGVAAALLAALFIGCQSTPKSSTAEKQAAPAELLAEGITTVAFLEMANTTDDDHAGERMAGLLESHVKGEGGYNLLGIYETAVRARRDPNASTDLERLRKDWRTTRRLDPAIMIRFGQAIGAQGILAAELLTWASEKIEWNVEGKSYSRVTCKLSFFDARSGQQVWSKTEDALLESAHYDPSNTAAYGDQGAVPSTELVNRAPEPPPIDQAAEKAARGLVRALPKPKTAS